VSKKRGGNTRKSRAKAVNSRPVNRGSKVMVWIALLVIFLLVVLAVVR
jgi:cytochrome b subunit of formate dehydrogenase